MKIMRAALLASAALSAIACLAPSTAFANVASNAVSGRIVAKPVWGHNGGPQPRYQPQAKLDHPMMARVVAIDSTQRIVTFRTDDGKYVSIMVTPAMLRSVRVGMRARIAPNGYDGVVATLPRR
jgi:hypothetical protein